MSLLRLPSGYVFNTEDVSTMRPLNAENPFAVIVVQWRSRPSPREGEFFLDDDAMELWLWMGRLPLAASALAAS